MDWLLTILVILIGPMFPVKSVAFWAGFVVAITSPFWIWSTL